MKRIGFQIYKFLQVYPSKVTSLRKEVLSSYRQKCLLLYFFTRRKITDASLFFSRGDCFDPVVLEYRRRAHSNGN